MNATLLQQHFRWATGTRVSTQTVRNRLHGDGLYARRPIACVRLTSRHRRDSREWATEHVNWRRNEWSNVLFSDESRFSVHPDNRRIFIWRDRGSRNNPAFVKESVRFGGGGGWGFSYAAAIGDDFILMDDNYRPHRAILVEDFLFEEGIVRMEWSACSPDMNTIEHVWDALGSLKRVSNWARWFIFGGLLSMGVEDACLNERRHAEEFSVRYFVCIIVRYTTFVRHLQRNCLPL
ncbi:transposable element Tcb2 transposase [Trichonephila clavipes]|nr:transposable element Tcb2 transposase [Trichonephila clavipes]